MEYMSADEITGMLDGLAVGSGRTREELEAQLAASHLPANDTPHLGFTEAKSVHTLPQERTEHLDGCTYCQRLVQTVYLTDLQIDAFQAKVKEQLDSRPRRSRWSPAVLPGIAAVFGLLAGASVTGFMRWPSPNSTEARLRGVPTSVIAVDQRVRPEPAAKQPVTPNARAINVELATVEARVRDLKQNRKAAGLGPEAVNNDLAIERVSYHLEKAQSLLTRVASAQTEGVRSDTVH